MYEPPVTSVRFMMTATTMTTTTTTYMINILGPNRADDCELDRTKRVKEARDEAKKEIERYKADKEEEYKKFEAEVWTIRPFPCHIAILDRR